MDLASIIGISVGFIALIMGFVLEGGHIGSLFAETALLIVFGGTFGAVITSFTMEDVKHLPQLFKIVFANKVHPIDELINIMVNFAEKARREGLLALEREISTIQDEFIKQGVGLIVDGNDPKLVRDILETQIDFTHFRHKTGVAMFEAAGGYAPTMGIIGTVMGLVHVLGNLSDPESLGPSIAVAFIATLYGVGTANLLWLPMATKLKNRSQAEKFYRTVALEGILSLQAGDKPLIVRDKMLSFVSAKIRQEAAAKGV